MIIDAECGCQFSVEYYLETGFFRIDSGIGSGIGKTNGVLRLCESHKEKAMTELQESLKEKHEKEIQRVAGFEKLKV